MSLFLLLVAAAQATDLDQWMLDTTLFPNALCNDGSAGAIYLSLAPGGSEHPDDWVVYFPDRGDACSTLAECAALSTVANGTYDAMGSGCADDPVLGPTCGQAIGVYSQVGAVNPWGPSWPATGVVSDDPSVNPAFADWNRVVVLPCSSDLWAGDGGLLDYSASGGFPTVDGSDVLQFRGAAIAGAAFFTLVVDYGLSPASRVVIAGSGTGAGAVLQHLDRVYDLLGGAAVDPDVRGIIDGSDSRAYPLQYDPTAPMAAYGCTAAISTGFPAGSTWYDAAYVAWDAVVDDSCEAALASSDRGDCMQLDPMLYHRRITTPLFYRQDLRDSVGVAAFAAADAGAGMPLPASVADEAECFTQTTHHRGLNAQRADALQGYFLPCEEEHVGLADDDPYAVDVANVHTMAELLESWVYGTGRVTRAAEPGCLVY